MSEQLLLVQTKMEMIYKRIEYINKTLESTAFQDQYKKTRNNYIKDLLVLKRRRNRLLGIIKEWIIMKLPDKDLIYFNTFCIFITIIGLGFAYREYITGWINMIAPYIKNSPYHRRNLQNKRWRKYLIVDRYIPVIKLKDIFNDNYK